MIKMFILVLGVEKTSKSCLKAVEYLLGYYPLERALCRMLSEYRRST